MCEIRRSTTTTLQRGRNENSGKLLPAEVGRAMIARQFMGRGKGPAVLIRSFFAAFSRAIPLPRSNCARLIDVRIIMAHHKHQQTPYPHQV